MLAAGVLAVLLALGTFSPQKAAAQTIAGAVTVSPTEATGGSDLVLKLGFGVSAGGTIEGGEEIVVDLTGFVLPDSIDPALVNIRTGTGTAEKRGNPASVSIEKGKVTLRLPNDLALSGDTNSVTFLRAVGIKAPYLTKGDASTPATGYPVNVSYGTSDGTPVTFKVNRVVSIKPTSGDRNTVITVTGAGLPANGTANIYVTAAVGTTITDGTTPITKATVTNGAFTATIDVSKNLGAADTVNKFSNGAVNVIRSQDPGVDAASSTAEGTAGSTFTLNGKVTLPNGTSLILGAKGIAVNIEDAAAGDIEEVKIGGKAVPFGRTTDAVRTTGGGGADADSATAVDIGTAGDDLGKASILIDVPADVVAVGADQKLELVDSSATVTGLGETKVSVSALALTLSPSTVVQGNTVTLLGSGFGDGSIGGSDGGMLTVAVGETSRTIIGSTSDKREEVSGSYAFTFVVPDLPAGKATVTLAQNDGKVGRGEMTIAKPTITVDPAEGRIGSTVTVEGTGFPAGGAIHITYGGAENVRTVPSTVTLVIADANGEFSARFAVPVGSNRGGTGNNVQAFRPMLDANNADRASNAVKHIVPKAAVTIDPEEGEIGDMITVAGTAHDPGVAVAVKIGASTVSERGLVTDANGDFSVEVAIPDLSSRFPVLTVDVDGKTVTSKTIEILEPEPVPPTRDVATEFADLIEAGVLENVFRYNADKTWSGYNPAAPAAANDLDTINSGDILWIKVNKDGHSYGGTDLTTEPSPWTLVVAP